MQQTISPQYTSPWCAFTSSELQSWSESSFTFLILDYFLAFLQYMVIFCLIWARATWPTLSHEHALECHTNKTANVTKDNWSTCSTHQLQHVPAVRCPGCSQLDGNVAKRRWAGRKTAKWKQKRGAIGDKNICWDVSEIQSLSLFTCWDLRLSWGQKWTEGLSWRNCCSGKQSFGY